MFPGMTIWKVIWHTTCISIAAITSFLLFSHLTGCATTSANWHAQSENEMRQVIGETVFMAMDQYQAYLEAIGEKTIQDSLKGQDDADKPTH